MKRDVSEIGERGEIEKENYFCNNADTAVNMHADVGI